MSVKDKISNGAVLVYGFKVIYYKICVIIRFE